MQKYKQYLDTEWFACVEPDEVDITQYSTCLNTENCIQTNIPALAEDLCPKASNSIWFYRMFQPELEKEDTHRIYLCFDQVICLCEVWVNGIHVGKHIHSEEKFSFDITDAIKEGCNLIACRIYGPLVGKVGPEGICMQNTPNFGQAYSYYTVIPRTGIYHHVYLCKKALLSIEDLYVNPDPDTETVAVELTLQNRFQTAQNLEIHYEILERGMVIRKNLFTIGINGNSQECVKFSAKMDHVHLWSPESPYLYDIHVSVTCDGVRESYSKRFGFKSLRIENGYFMLNGKRIWMAAAHSMHGKEAVIHAKTMGFKMLRFLTTMPSEELLDFCDEIGMLVYEESAVAWGMSGYPDMPKHMSEYLSNMIRRDRSHVCVGIWGIFNEQGGPCKHKQHPLISNAAEVFNYAVSYLPEMRKLDNTRLILLSSGRWDGRADIGSFSNPGSLVWDYGWGGEGPDATQEAPGTGNGHLDPYIMLVGDNHLYPTVPIQNDVRDFVRNIGKDTNPVYLSEYGVGYQFELYDFYLEFLKNKHPEHQRIDYFKVQIRCLEKFIEKYGLQHIYPKARDFLMASINAGAQQRLESIDPIRANPKLCGYSLSSFSIGHEGVYYRSGGFIPGIVDAIRDSFAPVKWSIFMDSSQIYADEAFEVEVVLCNEDVLPAGNYEATIAVTGREGVVFQKDMAFIYPKEKPLASSVMKIMVPGLKAGEYGFSVYLKDQLQPTCDKKHFRIYDREFVPLNCRIYTVGSLGAAKDFLCSHGVDIVDTAEEAEVICVGALEEEAARCVQETEVLNLAWEGKRVFILDDRFWDTANTSAQQFMQTIEYADDGSEKDSNVFGKRIFVRNWMYHLDNYIADNRIFEGIASLGLLDMDIFRKVYPDQYMIETAPTTRTFCAAFGCGLFAKDGCIAALTMGEFAFGKGKVVVNTFKLLPNIGTDPVADRILYNLIREYTKG